MSNRYCGSSGFHLTNESLHDGMPRSNFAIDYLKAKSLDS